MKNSILNFTGLELTREEMKLVKGGIFHCFISGTYTNTIYGQKTTEMVHLNGSCALATSSMCTAVANKMCKQNYGLNSCSTQCMWF